MATIPNGHYSFSYECSCGCKSILRTEFPENSILELEGNVAPKDIHCPICNKQVIIPKGRYAPNIDGILVSID